MAQHPGTRRRPALTRVAVPLAALVLALDSACGSASAGGGHAATRTAFPAIATAGLPASTTSLVGILRAQYQANRPGTDYSGGANEPWCADFVSWVEREHHTPLRNPNTGGWRIPGTMTLLDTFRRDGVWHAVHSGYRPVVGDVAIYDNPSPFGQHTNFVLGVDGDRITTVGGNEPGGIRVSTHTLDADLGVLGWAHPS